MRKVANCGCLKIVSATKPMPSASESHRIEK